MRRALGALANVAWRLQRTGAGASTAAPCRAALATQAGEAVPPSARAPFGHRDVLQQPTVQAALRLLNSLPAEHAQYPSLLGAALRRSQWPALDCGDPSERAAAAELVRRGWQCLSAMDGNDLTDLLRAAAALEPMAGKQLRVWQTAYEAWLARGGVRLSCNSRLDILQDIQQREVNAALNGLAWLGFDPGEGFVAACMRVVEADGGRNQMLVSIAAWALAVLQRCPPERWQALVALLQKGLPADLSSAEWEPRLHQWLTAYQLVRQQHGKAVAPLPADLLQRGVELAGARSAHRRRQAKRGLLQAVAAEVVRVMVGSRYAVEQAFWLVDPATNMPPVVDVAVPDLKFGVQLSRTYEVSRNTGAPLGVASILPRLARLAGWEVAVLPQEVLAAGKEQRDVRALVRAVHAFLLEHTRLPQLVAERAGAAS